MGRSAQGFTAGLCHTVLGFMAQMWGFPEMGAPLNHPDTPKWLVYFMENPIKVDDLGDPKMDGL